MTGFGGQGTISDGTMVLKLEGATPAAIPNGTYDFKVMHLQDGREIHYKGPFDLCCQFFDDSNCVWEGEYEKGDQVQVGGCPVAKGPWTATIKRPLWIRLPGTFKAVVTVFSETGAVLESVQALGNFRDGPRAPDSVQIEGSSSKGHGLALVSKETSEANAKDEGAATVRHPAAARQATPGSREGDLGSDFVDVTVQQTPWLLAGRNWTGTYRTVTSTCGAGCCCLSDAAAQFTWVEKEKAGSIRGTLSLQGAVREGSAGACKALERMSIRNFVLQRQDFTRAEKRFCQSACQTLVAHRSLDGDKVFVSLFNEQHKRCGEQRLECTSGPCLAGADLSQAHLLLPEPPPGSTDANADPGREAEL